MQRLAAAAGATLLGGTPVTAIRPLADSASRCDAGGTTYSVGSRRGLRGRVDQRAGAAARGPAAPHGDRGAGDLLRARPTPPRSRPSGSPCGSGWTTRRSTASRPTARPRSRRRRTAAARSSPATSGRGSTDPAMLDRLAAFMAATFPGSGAPVRSKRCLYTLTPDRDFVLDRVPGAERVVVGLGAAHAFKFVPTFGRRARRPGARRCGRLPTLEPFRLDRPGLTDPGFAPHWLV